MHFVTSAAAALSQLESSPVDALISDMRMPITDGAGLIEQVRSLDPSGLRIGLSGYSETERLVLAENEQISALTL